MTIIRPMQVTDIQSCAEFMAQSSFFSTYGVMEKQVISWLHKAMVNPNSDLEVALVEGVVVGFSWILTKGAFGRSPYLRLLAVNDNFHRQGIGKQLMLSLENKYKMKRDLFLLVTETNHKARSFYERLGYQYIGVLENYVKKNVNECLYRKVLFSL
jgi:ribosomal protein S18 acetylase RimI-like enzyme